MKEQKKMGRPVIEINFEVFEGLCRIHCTLPEIAGVLKVSEDTVERRVKEHYGETFAETFKKHSATGLMSLRRYQFKMAETNPAMAIWLGKQYLGQKEPRIDINVQQLDSEIDVELRRLAQLAAGSETSTSGEAESETIN